MPYGIPKSYGGDTAANVTKMERCVNDLMKKGYNKTSAIRICKAKLFPTGRKKRGKKRRKSRK